MMPKVFYKALPFVKAEALLALEAGADGLVVPGENLAEASALARVEVLAADEARFVSLTGRESEDEAAGLLQQGEKVILSRGWQVIAVENLLARLENFPSHLENLPARPQDAPLCLGVEAAGFDEAVLASEILERGVPLVVVTREGLEEIRPIVAALKQGSQRLELLPATVRSISPAGMGHRVCVDTTSLFRSGQGMLAGNSAGFLFLVNAETEPSPYVAERPFRINAGAVHSYCLLPGDRTAYLGELRAGSRVLVADHTGESGQATVGRAKVEQRPMLLVEAEARGPDGETRFGAIFLQNAETIRLVSPEGLAVSVVDLEPGSRVLCRVDAAGRHFGLRIQEDISEE